jgi:hypothetical protein
MTDDREPYIPGQLDTAPFTPGDPPDEPVAAPVAPARRGFNPQSVWFWPVVNVIGIAAVVFVNWLANALPLNDQSTGEVLTRDPVWFQPAGWAFSIWGLIYALLVVFGIAGFLPLLRDNPHLRRIGPLLLVTNLANMIWLFCWHWEKFTASIIVMAVLLLSLVAIVFVLHAGREPRSVSRWERWLMWPVFSIYLGWISVATLANLMVWWDRSGWSGGPISLRLWAVVFLVAGGVICYVMAILVHDGWYPAVFAFAGVAIAVEVWDRSRLVSTVAGLMALIEVLLVIMVLLVLFDRKPALPRFTRRSADTDVPLAG